MLTPQEWHQRFIQQARWTVELRSQLSRDLRFVRANRILEVGCGTGAITATFPQASQIFGIDHELKFLHLAHAASPRAHFFCADGLCMPYAGSAFDICVCHFYLLWLANPLQGLIEMCRVTRPAGMVVAFAEPDYAGRIDYPPTLARLGQLQGESLRHQGADPDLGRKLAALFHQAGLVNVHTGLLGGHWSAPPAEDAWESEWAMLQSDLHEMLAPEELNHLRQLDAAAWQKGERILFVPTFYAWGQMP